MGNAEYAEYAEYAKYAKYAGTRRGTFEKVPPHPLKTLKLETFLATAPTEASSSRKVSSTFSKVAGCGAEPRRTAFLFVNFFFAPFSHKEKVAKALIYLNSQ